MLDHVGALGKFLELNGRVQGTWALLWEAEGPLGELSVDSPQRLVNSIPTCWALPVGQAVSICSNHPGGSPGASSVGLKGRGLGRGAGAGHSQHRDH